MKVFSQPGKDPRLQPTPDYGALGPAADAKFGDRKPIEPGGPSMRAYAVVCAGIALGILCAAIARSGAVEKLWQEISRATAQQRSSRAVRSRSADPAAQAQAETLLQRAVGHDAAARDEIAAHLDEWRGKIEFSDRLNGLMTAGLNSDDLEVRGITIDVDLAALDVSKTSASIDSFERQALTGPQNQRVWALWTLGLLGNRGVEPERVARILQSQLQDSNVEVRHWAVEGLAYLGTSDAIQPLLKSMRDDPSPMVRERAACSLAQSGMLTHAQRQSVVPTLIGYAEDPSLDASTRAWTYHALSDITGQTMPNDPAAWRRWYNSSAR
ncbi:MAG TPA: HEAT repeat domain-containing protein [Terriglobales bacterium]|nr:HEAT repeat domain-containing protein [Terriglobales bacterium]